MKLSMMILLFLTSTNLWSREVITPIKNIFVPDGIESDDTAQVFIRGFLPNSCVKNPQYKMRKKNNLIEIKVYGEQENSQALCAEVVTPFSLKVDIGKLSADEYTLFFNRNSRSPYRRIMDINRDNPTEPELYAKVHDFKVKDNKLYLQVIKPSNCYILDEIEIIDNDRKTYTVFPKLVRDNSKHCIPRAKPVIISTQFNNSLKVDEALFHVRSYNNESVNKVIKLQ